MISMETNLKDLVPVINACKKSGVTLFKTGDIEIHFGPQPEPVTYQINYPEASAEEKVNDPSPRVDLEELALTDPSAWAAADMGDE
jgi:hypothetical protein